MAVSAEINELKPSNTINLENKEILYFLVNTFFGENIDNNNLNYGKTYTMRGNNPALDIFRYMSVDEYEMKALIGKIYELNGDKAERREKWRPMLEKLEEAGIIRQNLSFRTTYSFAFLYKFYLRLRGNPATNR